MLVTSFVDSNKPRKASNTVKTTVEAVLIPVRTVELTGSSTHIYFDICIHPRLITLCQFCASGLLVRFYFTLVKLRSSS